MLTNVVKMFMVVYKYVYINHTVADLDGFQHCGLPAPMLAWLTSLAHF